MENIYRVRALHLLAEDARLKPQTKQLVLALLDATPVALRGYATMMPMSALMTVLKTDAMDSAWHDGTEEEVLQALDDVDTAHWSMPSLRGSAIGSFLKGHALSVDSGLLHFQIDNDLIAALEEISQQLQANSNEPPEMKH